jgi:hypothetical protein
LTSHELQKRVGLAIQNLVDLVGGDHCAYQPYRSGKNPGWIKVKCPTWRKAHKNRGEMFDKGGRVCVKARVS